MDKSLLQKYARRDDARAADGEVEEITTVDLGCFGYLRGIRDRAVMLELRKKSGDCLAISYAFLDRIEYDPSNGIRIHAGSTTITVQGRNLNMDATTGPRLFEGLTRHRVSWILEVDEFADTPDAHGQCRITGIFWESSS